MASKDAKAKMAAAIEQARKWNHDHAVGTRVIFRRADGTKVHARVRSRAGVTSDGVAVVWLMGVAGEKPLDRIEETL